MHIENLNFFLTYFHDLETKVPTNQQLFQAQREAGQSKPPRRLEAAVWAHQPSPRNIPASVTTAVSRMFTCSAEWNFTKLNVLHLICRSGLCQYVSMIHWWPVSLYEGYLIDWLIDWLIDSLIHRFIDRLHLCTARIIDQWCHICVIF